MTRSFDVFFDLRLNKRLSKQPWGWWFETQSLSLWRHCNDSQCICCTVARITLRVHSDSDNATIGFWCQHTLRLNYHLLQMTAATWYHWIGFVTVLSLCFRKSGVTGPLPRCWPFVREIHRSPVNSPHKRKVTSASLYSMTQSFDHFFDVCLDIRLNKQGSCRRFEMPWSYCQHVLITSDFNNDTAIHVDIHGYVIIPMHVNMYSDIIIQIRGARTPIYFQH